ncbi:MAG: hypothetical protein NT178_07425 [Proteobacteria bacterium]|nr:hypothetical protein [Pseudomonadota bacterium]
MHEWLTTVLFLFVNGLIWGIIIALIALGLSLMSSKEAISVFLACITMRTINTTGFLGAAVLRVVLGKVLFLGWADIGLCHDIPGRGVPGSLLICLGVAFAGFIAALFMKETYYQSRVPDQVLW